jgi:hypothetical protein
MFTTIWINQISSPFRLTCKLLVKGFVACLVIDFSLNSSPIIIGGLLFLDICVKRCNIICGEMLLMGF